jgi:hypothetical protein
MTRLAALALLPWIAGAPLAEAQPPTPSAPTAPAAPAAPAPPSPSAAPAQLDAADANQTRRRLNEIFRTLPPSVEEVLQRDPSLLNRADYLTPYPRLVAFLQQHPEIALNPAFFLGTPYMSDRDPGARSMAMVSDIFEGIGVLAVMGTVFGFMAWLIRTLVDHRRWLRVTKTQVDVHTSLMQRLSTNEDVLAYVQSPAGRRFLESAPIELESGQARPTGAALGRVLLALQAGVVLMALGIGFMFVQRQAPADAVQGFSIISTLALALGIGFVAAAAVSYVISMRHGLIAPQPQPGVPHD